MAKEKLYQVVGTAHMAVVVELMATSARDAMDKANELPGRAWDLVSGEPSESITSESASVKEMR
jgi:hypothetical protein